MRQMSGTTVLEQLRDNPRLVLEHFKNSSTKLNETKFNVWNNSSRTALKEYYKSNNLKNQFLPRYEHIKEDAYIIRESNSSIIIFASILNGDLLLKDRICSSRSKFFSLKVDLILKWFCSQGKILSQHQYSCHVFLHFH